jgi:hypothetical protein
MIGAITHLPPHAPSWRVAEHLFFFLSVPLLVQITPGNNDTALLTMMRNGILMKTMGGRDIEVGEL